MLRISTYIYFGVRRPVWLINKVGSVWGYLCMFVCTHAFLKNVDMRKGKADLTSFTDTLDFDNAAKGSMLMGPMF